MIYITESKFDFNRTNIIQTNNMCIAFSNYEKVNCIVNGVKSITTSYNLINLFSRIRVIFIIRVLSYMLKNINKDELIYSRSLFISFLLVLFSYKNIVFEIHHLYNDSLFKFILKKVILKSNIGVVVISNELKKDIIKMYDGSIDIKKIYIFHDCHHNTQAKFIKSKNKDFKVGYFGKVIKIKGSDLLEDIIRNSPDTSFHIYTQKIDRKLNYPNVKIFYNFPHKNILSEMYKMDLFLMTIAKINDRSDFSNYTSPLKLFEYLSCGRPVICSDFPSVREINLKGDTIKFLDNDKDLWIKNINLFKKNKNLRELISRKTYNLSKKYTWNNRAKQIYKIMKSNKYERKV